MKKRLLFVLSLALAFCGSLLSCSDDDPNMKSDNSQISQINEFLNSEYGITTLKNHGLSVSNLDLKNSNSELFKSKEVIVFTIPIIENGHITGRLNAFSIIGDNSYRAIVEKWEQFSNQEYSVTVTTGFGRYLATVNIIQDDKRKIQKIIDIAPYNDNEVSRARPTGESWWACTARVYHTAKKACNEDSQCDFLCDLVNLTGGCTVSMAAAAAIACV